jgi:hypothetical protein
MPLTIAKLELRVPRALDNNTAQQQIARPFRKNFEGNPSKNVSF